MGPVTPVALSEMLKQFKPTLFQILYLNGDGAELKDLYSGIKHFRN